jgi:hypothetical protein
MRFVDEVAAPPLFCGASLDRHGKIASARIFPKSCLENLGSM